MPTRREARTSVLPEGQNLGAGGIQFRRANEIKGFPRKVCFAWDSPAPASTWSAARRKRPNAREQAHSEPRRRKSSCAVGARCFLRSGKQCAVAEGVRRDS